MPNYKNIKNLFILPFDHRSGFAQKMLGFDEDMTDEQIQKVKDYKHIVYDGIKNAIACGMSIQNSGVLVDEIFGTDILLDAKSQGFVVMQTVEKSGQDRLELEYHNWKEHLLNIRPTYAKVLVRYNVRENNIDQLQKLKELSDFVHNNNIGLLIEPLMQKGVDFGIENNGERLLIDQDMYDKEYRYKDLCYMIREMQDFGIEADIWKIEGLYKKEQYIKAVEVARSLDLNVGLDDITDIEAKNIVLDTLEKRSHVGIIILGRNETKDNVLKWIKAGRDVDGVVGFAVGRTIFWDPLLAYRDGEIDRQEAVNRITKEYMHYYKVFTCDNMWCRFLEIFN